MPPKHENGFIMLGLGTNGITGSCISKFEGMKLLIQYRGGLPLIWVQAEAKPTLKATNE